MSPLIEALEVLILCPDDNWRQVTTIVIIVGRTHLRAGEFQVKMAAHRLKGRLYRY